MSEILDGYISRSELAKQLDIHERSLERWDQLTIGPPVTKIGVKRYYKIDSVRAWLDSREQSRPRGARNERASATA